MYFPLFNIIVHAKLPHILTSVRINYHYLVQVQYHLFMIMPCFYYEPHSFNNREEVVIHDKDTSVKKFLKISAF